jgi:hypothetical protein
MTPDETRSALRAALADDEVLASRFAAATTEEELRAIAEEAGVPLALEEDDSGPRDLSEEELATVSGGYTFPPTDWIYCDNPWTNVYCTLKC